MVHISQKTRPTITQTNSNPRNTNPNSSKFEGEGIFDIAPVADIIQKGNDIDKIICKNEITMLEPYTIAIATNILCFLAITEATVMQKYIYR